MSQKHKHSAFDELFQQKLEGHEMHGSDELWESINSDFPKIDSEKKERRRFIFFRWLTSGLFVMLLSTVAYYEWRLSNIQEEFNQRIETAELLYQQNGHSNIISNTNQKVNESSIHQTQNESFTYYKSSGKNTDKQEQYSQNNTVDARRNNQYTSSSITSSSRWNRRQNRPELTLKMDQPSLVNYHTSSMDISKFNTSKARTNTSKNTRSQINETTQVKDNVIENILRENTITTPPDSGNFVLDNSIEEAVEKPLLAASIDSTELDTTGILHDSLLTKNVLQDEQEALIEEEEEESIPKVPGRFSVMLFASPDYTFRKLAENPNSNNLAISHGQFNQKESGAISYTLGTRLAYRISHSLSIFTGISYSRYAQSFSSNGATPLLDTTNGNYTLNTSLGSVNFYSASHEKQEKTEIDGNLSFSSTQKISVLSIPLQLQYGYDLNLRHRLFVHTGVNLNFILSSQNEVTLKEEHNSSRQFITKNGFRGLKSSYYGASFGIGYAVKLSRHFSLVVNPVFRTAFTPVNQSNGVKSYPYSFGLASGLKFRF